MNRSKVLTTKEVSALLGVTPGRVHQLVREGRLFPTREGWKLLFTMKDVQRFLRLPRNPGGAFRYT